MPQTQLPLPSLTLQKGKKIFKNAPKSAAMVNLVYQNDQQEGISRKFKNDKFHYYLQGKLIKDKDELERIKKLAIPPAWEKVWISPLPNSHLQATGIDKLNRKQYRYHPHWNQIRNISKFSHLHDFGLALPNIRKQLKNHLSLPALPLEKILATVVALMERTNIRIGNNQYEKMYGSYGLTTLKNKHVQIEGTQLRFKFKGKKGIMHDISVRNKKISNIIRKCKELPGRELFQYVDENNMIRSIDSGMVNQYLKTIGAGDFSAKDFRTWAGTVNGILAVKKIDPLGECTNLKANVNSIYDMVSQALGNTKTVCKKYYVHPVIISLYENNGLSKYLEDFSELDEVDEIEGYTCAEKALMKILANK